MALPQPVGGFQMAHKITTTLTINGQRQTITATEDTPLLWVLREQLKLTGTKFGCGVGRGVSFSNPAARMICPD